MLVDETAASSVAYADRATSKRAIRLGEVTKIV